MSADCTLILVGDELLAGMVTDANLPFLGSGLPPLGIRLKRAVVAPDDPTSLAREIVNALGEGQIVLVAGGLGPTEDDVTRDAAADALGEPLVESTAARDMIEAFYERLSRTMPPSAAKESLVPRGAEVLANPVGAAPGILARTDGGGVLVLLPGVPRELQAVFQESVAPLLSEQDGGVARSEAVRTCGVREVDLEERVAPLRAQYPGLRLSFLPQHYVVDVVLSGAGADEAATDLVRLLGWHVLGRGRPSLERLVGQLLVDADHSVGIAESLTGGLVSDALTDVPGSSRYVWGGVTAYSNAAKTKLLGVAERTLKDHGAVSREVAAEMAMGARVLGVTYGLSLTGIAGPGGGSPRKPVGLVYVGLASPESTWVYSFLWNGDRRTVKEYGAAASLNALRLHLMGAPHDPVLVGARDAWCAP
jgi:nicotinamide-nucleotide amidase